MLSDGSPPYVDLNQTAHLVALSQLYDAALIPAEPYAIRLGDIRSAPSESQPVVLRRAALRTAHCPPR